VISFKNVCKYFSTFFAFYRKDLRACKFANDNQTELKEKATERQKQFLMDFIQKWRMYHE
jgi:hypothetical protein